MRHADYLLLRYSPPTFPEWDGSTRAYVLSHFTSAVRHPNGRQPFELWKRTTPRAHGGAAPQTKAKLSVDFQYRPGLSCRLAPESLNLPVIEQLWRAELRSPATSRRAWRRRCHPSTSRRGTARIQPSSYAAACRSGDSTMVAIRTSWMRTTQPERTLVVCPAIS